MNIQELIKEIKKHAIYHCGEKECYKEGCTQVVDLGVVLEIINQLDEPETGHADEAPRYLKNILARLRELPLHNREVWLKVIMSEFKQDFSHAKWREGYEQGKLEGMVEREKVKVKQFVADWIDYFKKTGDWDLFQAMDYLFGKKEIREWLEDKNNQETFALAWIFGYEVEEEKRYLVKVKGMSEENTYLTFRFGHMWMLSNFEECEEFRLHHTRKELEDADFGWVFDCPGIEIEEVE